MITTSRSSISQSHNLTNIHIQHMKKFFAVFLMASVLAIVALPVMAAPEPLPPGKDLPGGPTSGTSLLNTVDLVTNWVFAVFTVLTVIMVLLAAFQFVTAGGDAAKVGEARQKLIWAAVGIIIALSAKGMVPVLRTILGV